MSLMVSALGTLRHALGCGTASVGSLSVTCSETRYLWNARTEERFRLMLEGARPHSLRKAR
jgi:hypothetical protein